MRKYFLLLIFITFSVFTEISAQYSFSSIPDSMKKDADYIVWEDYHEFKVINPGKAVEHVRLAVLITDQYAKRFDMVQIGYSKDLKINSFSASIYDASGKRVRKLKSEDIVDVSAVSGGSLYTDYRRKVLRLEHHTYPYTIVYEFKRTHIGLLSYPSGYFQNGFNTSVFSSVFKIIIPNNMKFKYREYNLNKPVELSDDGDEKIYKWKEQNLVAKEYKELLPSEIYYMPILLTAPLKFEMEGYSGSTETWNEFAKWRWKLNKDRGVIPVESSKLIEELIKDAENDKQKAKILYEFMQNKTRYVSVQEGVGGWQSFPAEYVDKNGYGDCKALSNYMQTLLKYVGIKSHYTVVLAGKYEDDIITDFPSNQSNHVILCLPQEKDTIWLECTSQQQPFGFLGSFTDDRHVLIMDGDDGKLVKTLAYGKDVNTQIRIAKINVDTNGDVAISTNAVFRGLKYEEREYEIEKSVKDQKKFLYKEYELSGMIIKSYNYSVDKSEIPSITENLELEIPKLASVSSKRMFLKLNLFNQLNYVPEKNTDRKIPFEIKRAYTEIDSIQVNIPEGYKIENIPSEKSYITKFGEYSTKVIIEENKILFVRKLTVEKGVFPSSDYVYFYNVRKKIKKADKAKLVLVKKAND